MLFDVILLLVSALSTLLFQLIGFFWMILVIKKLPRFEFWAWGRLIGWLGVGLMIWLVAHLHIPLNTSFGFWLVMVTFSIAPFLFRRNEVQKSARQFFSLHWKNVLFLEFIFVLAFLFLGIVRTYHPAVLDLEKFMDAGFMQGYMRSPVLPAEDMWFAGKIINYYTFGHFLGSLMLRFWGVPVELGYNILLGWIFGLVMVESYALGRLFLRSFFPSSKKAFLALGVSGLAFALLNGFAGNSHGVWYFLKHGSFKGYWYPDATRFIDFTIHEFPSYSFIVSDLHAHVWSLPLVLCILAISWGWYTVVFSNAKHPWRTVWKKKEFLLVTGLLGVMLGIAGMTNTWDMFIYSLFLSIVSVGMLVFSPKIFPLLVISGVGVLVGSLVVLFPWLYYFDSIAQAIVPVVTRSPGWQLAVLWAGHSLMLVMALAVAIWRVRRKDAHFHSGVFLIGIAVTALVLLLIPELIYFKDIYPNHPRANTMFKFTFQAFILMNFLAAWLAGFLMKNDVFPKVWRGVLIAGTIAFFLSVLSYTFFGYREYYGSFKQYQGLNGLIWLRSKPDDLSAIMWLRDKSVGRPVVVEAVGESYTEYARVSVFTGLPTVLGWRVHEWLWRGSFEMPSTRTEEVRAIYEEPLSRQAAAALARYDVQFIFVGNMEREAYELDMNGLRRLGEIVFQQGNTFIIKRNL